MKPTKKINNKLYKKIVELVPIVCVDVILEYRGAYVLVKRATEPLKGSWWIVGGRAYKGEPTLKTAKRKVKEEVGLEADEFDVVGIYEDHYPKSAWGTPTSSVSIVYKAVIDYFEPKLDKTSKEIEIFSELPKRLIKKMIWIKDLK